MLDTYGLFLFWEMMYTALKLQKGNEKKTQEKRGVYTLKWRSQQVILVVLTTAIFHLKFSNQFHVVIINFLMKLV